ncbi:class II aldolase [Bradyrhizobium sp. SK17]|uniref:class II aldolase/adducin family protein n=1 Tax=Bradyrhizobium sp. SK17 TaxID=2057741 RepID=UPI000C304D04|nr:class II aldolase/adducin family protein [Bradyrhizobium sp. SK17]AUC98830.1 class II aldolase [Bradyrhizobium sp. SK17]
MQQPAQINDLREMSARVGRNMLLVQGAGGNSSVKDRDTLWVKASGTWLSDATDKDIFVPVALSAALAALEQGDERVPLAPGATTTLRASIETSLHALMPHPVVLHVHSVNTIAWAVRTDAPAELTRRLAGLNWRYLDYCHPGLPLAQAVSAAIAREPVDVLILGNHGLVVGATTCEAAEAMVADVEQRLALMPREALAADSDALRSICAGTDYRVPSDPRCHGIATDRHNLAVATGGSLYPDHVVFLGRAMPTLGHGGSLRAADLKKTDAPPPVAVLIPGIGSVIRKDASAGAEAMLSCLALVTCRLPPNAPIHYLTEQNENALLNWDAERYRQQLTASR